MKINNLLLKQENQVGDFHCQGLTLTILTMPSGFVNPLGKLCVANEYFGKLYHLFRKGQYLLVSGMICTAPWVLKFDDIKVLVFLRVRS